MRRMRCGHDREQQMQNGECEACVDLAHYGPLDVELRRQFAADAGVTPGRMGRAADEYDAERREQRQW